VINLVSGMVAEHDALTERAKELEKEIAAKNLLIHDTDTENAFLRDRSATERARAKKAVNPLTFRVVFILLT